MKQLTKLCLLLSFFIAGSNLEAQPWMQNFTNPNPNFFEIQTAFNTYWEGKQIEKGKGYKQFKRWEWYWEQRVGKSGMFPPSDILYTEWEKYNASHSNRAPQLSDATWTFTGPNSSPGGYHGVGRVNCIAFHPTVAQTFWVGTPAGGLWKTTNGGNTWTTNTDNLPVLGISDIAINPSNPSVMYIATGDGDAALSLSNGYGDTKSCGVLKSTNGGTTWNTTGLNFSQSSQVLIRRLLIHPTNSNILLAATSGGIYKTTDAGNTWNQQAFGWFIDMEFKPGDANYVYATTYDPNGDAQIFTSTNNGNTWSQVTAFSGYSRINLAVSANSPALVDAVCVTDSDNGLGALWYSANSGSSFSQYFWGTCTNNLLNSSFDASSCGGQGNYDLAYAINPNDADEIWIGGVNTWRSTDAGTNWSLRNIWSGQETATVQEVHADKHFIAFHPLNSSLVYECNDGGLYVTSDGGNNWTNLSNGLGIAQIYRISASALSPNVVITGLQDNGTRALSGASWYELTGGDGMECIIDYTDEDIGYSTYVQGLIYKTTDGWVNNTEIVGNSGTGVDEAGEWVTPYIIHPTNHNTLLVGKSQVYKTTDGGNSWSQLGTISGMGGNLLSLAYAPSNTNTIYAASAYEIFKTTNGGSSWSMIATATDRITYLAVDPSDAQRMYFTLSGYTAGSKVWMTPDGGANWYNYSASLPNVPVNCIVYQNGTNEGLYIGTDLGVFFTDGTMSDWVSYNTGLPNVVVNDLEISYSQGTIWAGTFGRGLWKSDLFVGIKEEKLNNVSVYPNPNNGTFTVQMPENSTYDIAVFNMLGEIVMEETKISSSTKTIMLDKAPAGVYFVKIGNGTNWISKKIIISK